MNLRAVTACVCALAGDPHANVAVVLTQDELKTAANPGFVKALVAAAYLCSKDVITAGIWQKRDACGELIPPVFPELLVTYVKDRLPVVGKEGAWARVAVRCLWTSGLTVTVSYCSGGDGRRCRRRLHSQRCVSVLTPMLLHEC
jgi:hypothetical protein